MMDMLISDARAAVPTDENSESNVSKIARGTSNTNAKILTTCVIANNFGQFMRLIAP